MTTVLAVSPHLDDAAFSAGGTIARLVANGARVVVATVFTATMSDPKGFALACQLDKGLGPEVDYMALRRGEDRAACAALGAEARHLPLREAPHRGYASAAELFGGMRGDDDVVDEVGAVLSDLLGALRPALVLAPQAVGAHVDHRAVVLALLATARKPPLLWWRDHPYTIRTGRPAEPFGEAFDAMPLATVRLDGGARAAKVSAALAYESQLGFQFGGAEAARRVFEDAEPVERLRGAAESTHCLEQLMGG